MSGAVARRNTGGAGMTDEIFRALGRIEGQIGHFDKRLDDHATAASTAMNALRQDIVRANGELRKEVSAHATDLQTLKDDRAGRVGAFKLATALKDFSPWIVGGLLGLIAYLK